MGTGIVAKEESARGIRATADAGARALDQEFGGGTSDGGEEPFEAALAGYELERPGPVARDEFVVTFGDAQDFVDGLGPRGRERLLVDDGTEDGTEGLTQTKDAE